MKTVEVSIGSDDWNLKCRMTVHEGPAQVGDLLPLARALSDAVVGAATQAVEQAGERVSCRKGCGACCRHLVAISEVEARRVRQLVEEMPEPRRSEIRARFQAAHERLAKAGLLERLERRDEFTDAEYESTCVGYFEQHLACPFLENESCSIHEERPITCREYLVTSPAENCSRPVTADVRRVKLPLRVFAAVARWQVPPTTHFLERWVPLILAPDWAEAHPNDPPPQPGLELLSELLELIAGKRNPAEEETAPEKSQT